MKALKSNIISIISIIVILACIAPMLYFFKFGVLGGDDFLYGRETFHALQDTGSYLTAVKIAFKNTWDTYLGWQGSFFSVFLMYLHPGIISLSPLQNCAGFDIPAVYYESVLCSFCPKPPLS